MRIARKPLFNAVQAQSRQVKGAVAQLVERLLCMQEVVGSIPSSSTILSEGRSQRTEVRKADLRLQMKGHGDDF